MYRTGDVVLVNDEGELEFIGREDRQIKLRGQRLEIEGVESCLMRHPAVVDALVVQSGGPEDEELIAYIVQRPDSDAVNESELRAYLAETLPPHAIPGRYQALSSIPQTRNGKVDYAALPKPTARRPKLAIEYVPPQRPLERVLHDLWAAVLKIERIGMDDPFVELGGNSLSALRIIAHVRKLFGIEVVVAVLFQRPTIAGLRDILLERYPQAELDVKAQILEAVRAEGQPAQTSAAASNLS